MGTKNRLVKAASFIMVASIMSKILGLGREMTIAAAFGASNVTDAYFIALSIPAVLFAVVAAAISTILIPIFTDYRLRNREEFEQLTASTLNAILLIVGTMAVLGLVFAPLLVKIIAPGFDGEQYNLTVQLTRILLPGIILMALTYWAIGFLHSKQHFSAPALVGIPNNIIIICAVLLTADKFGIYGLAVGTVIALLSQFLIQLPALRKEQFEYRRIINWQHPGLKKAAGLLVPVVLGTGAEQINRVVDRMLASGLVEGSISALTYAERVKNLPHGLFTVAIVTAIYPTLSTYSAENDINRFKYALRRGMKTIAFIVLPTMVGLIVLREEIVRVLFERGNFTAESTQMTAFALGFYALGLLALGWKELLAKVFYSLQDTATPMYVGISVVVLNIVLNLILIKYLAHGGLALASSLALSVGALMLLILLRRKVGSLGGRDILVSFGWMVTLSVLMGGLVFYAKEMQHTWLDLSASLFGDWVLSGILGELYQLTFLIILGGAFYIFGARLLKLEEIFMVQEIFQKIFSRFKRKKRNP